VNRTELEMRIWGKSISSARKAGIISDAEAQFLVDEHFKDFQMRNGWNGKTYMPPQIFGSSFPVNTSR
jgi:hypothetical protein